MYTLLFIQGLIVVIGAKNQVSYFMENLKLSTGVP